MNANSFETNNTSASLVARIEMAPEPTTQLEDPLRVRVSSEMEADLSALEAHFRGKGFRHATRSHLVRLALTDYLENAQEIVPEAFKQA